MLQSRKSAIFAVTMIIYNTTFQMADADAAQFLEWLRTAYVPQALASGHLSRPQLARVMASKDEGRSYALQFHVASLAALQQWHRQVGQALQRRLVAEFGTRVVGFSTMMQVVEL